MWGWSKGCDSESEQMSVMVTERGTFTFNYTLQVWDCKIIPEAGYFTSLKLG